MSATNAPRLAGCVILYHPDLETLERIASFRASLGRLYVVDNSPAPPDPALKTALDRDQGIEYLPRFENIGMAAALNLCAQKALDNGFDFLLTMDQDSRAAPGMVEAMLDSLDQFPAGTVGMLSPRHVTKASGNEPPATRFEEVLFTMTSGCLLDLKVFRQTGPFLEDLFIDYVDIEYCLRLTAKGFKVVRANEAVLHHGLGRITLHRGFLGRRAYTTNHAPERLYSITRNMLLVWKLYGRAFPVARKNDWIYYRRRLLKILLYEDQPIRKLCLAARGALDYWRGKFGKFEG